MQFDDLLKQARGVQARLDEAQQTMKDAEVTGESGGGLVRVTLNGSFEALRVRIDSTLADEPLGIVEDLVAAAINDGARRIESQRRDKLRAMAQTLGLPPGFKLPL